MDIMGQVMPMLDERLKLRTGPDQVGRRWLGNSQTAGCLGLRFYCFCTLEFRRKYSTEIRKQTEILKALGFTSDVVEC